MARQIAWTPEGSKRGVGSILIRQPIEPLGLTAFRFALADRIDRLIQREDPEVARKMLEVVEVQDWGLGLASVSLRMMGEFLAENSETLHLLSGAGGFPVHPREIVHEPETAARLEQETLEQFFGALYLE